MHRPVPRRGVHGPQQQGSGCRSLTPATNLLGIAAHRLVRLRLARTLVRWPKTSSAVPNSSALLMPVGDSSLTTGTPVPASVPVGRGPPQDARVLLLLLLLLLQFKASGGFWARGARESGGAPGPVGRCKKKESRTRARPVLLSASRYPAWVRTRSVMCHIRIAADSACV
jgi:hypothetical protein